MTYAYDDWVQMPVKDLYNTAIMKMAIDAAKDMYDKSQGLMENFYKTYGDFMSPFAKDMEAYGTAMNNVRSVINDAYSRGIDMFKSPEGRMLMLQLSHSIDPRWYNTAKQNAKVGYAYLDAMQDLRRRGKYSEAQELFDIAYNHGTMFQDFSTLDDKNNLRMWDRSSPVEATTLRDLTYKSYEHRTARDLTPEDFKTDKRLKGMVFDPRYQYSGYLDSDLMKVAPGASMSLAGDPRAEFFRDEARKRVIARGMEPTAEAIEAQFQRDIADANAWALIDPTKKADDFAKMDYSHKLAVDLENLKAKHDRALEEFKQANKQPGPGEGDYGGGYLLGLANSARGLQIGAQRAGLVLNPKRQKQFNEMLAITDPVARDRKAQILKTNLMIDFLNGKMHGSEKSIERAISSLENSNYGVSGRTIVNNILSNFATNSNNTVNNQVVLESFGFESGEKNGTYVLPEDTKVVSPHQLLNNIIKYGSGNFKKKQQLLKAIEKNADTSNDLRGPFGINLPDWGQATTNSIANRARTVKLANSGKNVIVAPDEHGVNRMYMKVNTVSDSWFDGDHAGFWVATPITYGDLGITSDNTPLIQGSEELEGKLYGNSQRKEAFQNRRD